MNKTFGWLIGGLLLGALPGCGDDAGTGTLAFTTWGEAYLEEGIPASGFADGYSVKFDRLLVIFGKYKVSDAEGNVAIDDSSLFLFDNVVPGVKPLITFPGIEAKAWPFASYHMTTATLEQLTLTPSVTQADAEFMTSNHYVSYVEGTISKDAVSKTFHWGFTEPIFYDECKGPKEGREVEGVVITNGGTDTVECTTHGDHFFFDNLQAKNAVDRAQAVVDADANGDGEVTLEELDQIELLNLPEDQYFTGAASDIDSLGDFVRALNRTIGHFRGEGECFPREEQ